MKTTVSIPDDVFQDAECVAARLRRSRSELYTHALREYVARYGPQQVTATLDTLSEGTAGTPGFRREAARRILERSDRDRGGMADQDALELVVDRLVERFDPIRIILFGSQAQGHAVEGSDFDVLVVLERMEHKRRALAAMLDAVADLPVSVDSIPTDPAEIERRGEIVGDILRPALREGVVIYERDAQRRTP